MLVRGLSGNDIGRLVQLIEVEGEAEYDGQIGLITKGARGLTEYGFKPIILFGNKEELHWIPLKENDEFVYIELQQQRNKLQPWA